MTHNCISFHFICFNKKNFEYQENRISSTDSTRLSRHKDLLMEKMADFEATNKALRRILREQHEYEAAAIRLGEQRDVLLKKLADSDRRNEVN